MPLKIKIMDGSFAWNSIQLFPKRQEEMWVDRDYPEGRIDVMDQIK